MRAKSRLYLQRLPASEYQLFESKSWSVCAPDFKLHLWVSQAALATVGCEMLDYVAQQTDQAGLFLSAASL